MKRQAFIRELERAGCEFVRHGRRHDMYRNPVNCERVAVPRHSEVVGNRGIACYTPAKGVLMSDVEELEARILNLPRQDMARLRDWFLELDNQLWDQQIAPDFKAGKFQGLIDKARGELAQGKAREL